LDVYADVPLLIESAIKQGVQDSFSPSLNHGETKADKYPEPTSKVAHGEHVPVEMVDSDSDVEDSGEAPDPTPCMHIVDLQDLVRRTFLLDEQDNGQCFCTKIVEYVTDHEEWNQMDPEHVRFRCIVNDNQYEDIITYNKLMDYIQKNAENDKTLWHFKRISGHQGPLCLGDPH